MKDYFIDSVDLFFFELQKECLRTLKQENSAYDDLRKSHADESEEMEAILNDLPYKDMKFAEKFNEDFLRICSIEQDNIYLQGYRDCVKFLKLIQAI